MFSPDKLKKLFEDKGITQALFLESTNIKKNDLIHLLKWFFETRSRCFRRNGRLLQSTN